VDLLPRVLDAAQRFHRRPSDEQMAGLKAHGEIVARFV